MNISHFKIILVITAVISMAAACSIKPSQIPSKNGPALIVKTNQSYYAIFPNETVMPPFHCGSHATFNGRFTPSKKLILNNESEFRELYYEWMVISTKNLHPDSAVIIEFPSEYAVVRKVSRQKLVRKRKKEYKETLKWDRQYAGFFNAKKDSILLINMIGPKLNIRANLGSGWIVGTDAALEHIITLAYNLSDNSITNNFCEELNP